MDHTSVDSLLAALNPHQREVVLARRPCTAIAGPGAGKTKTMATKVAFTLMDVVASGSGLVGAASFTRDSATELKERIHKLIPPAAKRHLVVSTLHSLAFKQIRRKETDIANEGFRFMVVRGILKELSVEMPADEALHQIDSIKINGTFDEATDEAREMYLMYQARLERNGKIDHQDMIKLAIEGMEKGTIRPYPFKHLLVDEYQDVDRLQLRWVMLHGDAGAIITVVGDDDQSIYAFRHALGYRGMQQFSRHFEAQEIVMATNYRSKGLILEIADRVIGNNKERIGKVLVPDRGLGGEVFAHLYPDVDDEAFAAVTTLGAHLQHGRTAAILARNNRDLDVAEAAAQAAGVKYFRASGSSILKRPEAALLCDLLQLIEGSKLSGMDEVLAFARISEKELSALYERFGQGYEKLSPRVLSELGFSSAASETYRNFFKRFENWKDLMSRGLIDLVLASAADWLTGYAVDDSSARALKNAVFVLGRLIGTFSERISWLKRQNNSDQGDADALHLMSIHGSKGLEWDSVWMLRCEENVLPGENSTEPEERRIFYVAMTRARDWLTMSGSKKNPASRFLLETGVQQIIIGPSDDLISAGEA